MSQKRHSSGFRFGEQRKAPITPDYWWLLGKDAAVLCHLLGGLARMWGAGTPTSCSAVLIGALLHLHLTQGTFIFPITLSEKPQHSTKPLHLPQHAHSLLQTLRQVCRLSATHKHSHTCAQTPSPTVCPRGRGSGPKRPLGGSQGVFIEGWSEFMNVPGTRHLHPSGAKSGRPHGHPPDPEEGACGLCCQAWCESL